MLALKSPFLIKLSTSDFVVFLMVCIFNRHLDSLANVSSAAEGEDLSGRMGASIT